jgi:hypothetical protein
MVEELARRKAKGTFGKPRPNDFPADFAGWDQNRKLDYLVDALEDVDAGGVGAWDCSGDPCIAALIAIGEPAIPRLIDVMQKDKRLTRRLIIPSTWSNRASPSLPTVADTALETITYILRTRLFDPREWRGYYDASDQTAAAIRAYLAKYGAIPFPERMMGILTDPKLSSEGWREAAANLANLEGGPKTPATGLPNRIYGRKKGPYLALARFKGPTTAEAILAALDRELAAQRGDKRGDFPGAPNLYAFYLGSVIELGDTRITAELAKRSRAAGSIWERRLYAEAAHWLGGSAALRELADDFRQAKVGGLTNDADEFAACVATMARAGLQETDQALDALSKPAHPWHQQASSFLRSAIANRHASSWLCHPYCVPLLRKMLDDCTPTGTVFSFSDGKIREETNDGSTLALYTTPILSSLDGIELRSPVKEHWCDVVAETLNDFIVGLPYHHCLRKDADFNLAALRERLDQFRGRLRKATPRQIKVFEPSSYRDFLLIPESPPLDRPATAEDVKVGKAVFHFGGKGKRLATKLPLVGELKPKGEAGRGERVLIVQAETDADGSVVYGVIARYAIQAVPAAAFARVAPVDAKVWDEKK